MTEQDQPKDVCKEEVYNAQFRMHSADLYKFLYYKYGEANNPADMVQEAFIKLWDNCKNVTPAKVKSWLFTVANNLTLSSLARKKTADKYKAEEFSSSTTQDPEFLLEEQESKVQLDKALASLSEEQRVAFLLNRVEGKKHQEIAEMLGISRKGVEKRIYTALAKIRDQVDFFN